LGPHLVNLKKCATSIGDELPIRGVIDSFNRHDLGLDLLCVFVEIALKLKLRRGGPGDQDFTSMGQMFRDAGKKLFIAFDMPRTQGAMFVVHLAVFGVRVNSELLDLIRTDLKDAGGLMVEPDGSVKMMHGTILLR
jgi:hypothetical protein